MERELRLIELYSHQFREAHRLLNEEIGIPGSTEIDGCLENLEAKWDVLFRLYDVVIKGSEIEQMETQVHAMEDFRPQYLQIRRAAGRKKEKSPSTSTSSSSTATPHHVLATAMAKLTATKVPTFSGETVKWPEFWGVYELTVHQQRSLPVLEKFIKLKESLKGEAASVIEGLPLTTANYTAAIDLLTQHYGSAEVIIQENFRYLHNLPVVPPGNHSALKQFLFNSEIRLRSLESLGVPPESYVISFVPLLVDRLPKNVRTAWYRSIADKEEASEVGDVLAFLRKEVISQERSQTSEGTSRKRGANEESLDHPASKRARLFPSASGLTTLTKPENKRNYKNECCFCRAAHSAIKCELPLQSKFDVVRRERLCFICLRKGHRAANCDNSNPHCRKCNRRHHTALCSETNHTENQTQEGASSE